MTNLLCLLRPPALAVLLLAQGGAPDTTILNPPSFPSYPGAVRPDLRLPPYLPAPAPLPPATGAVAPPAPARLSPPPALTNQGPNTGYGTGGMQQPPGAPPNPPYPPGGLLH